MISNDWLCLKVKKKVNCLFIWVKEKEDLNSIFIVNKQTIALLPFEL